MTSEPLAELGRRLRAAREGKGWTLQQASERTRITARNLGAIEAGDLSKFPAAVYVRGFVRSYANALDLAEDEELKFLDAAGFTAPSAAVSRPGVPGVEPLQADGEGAEAPEAWERFIPTPRTILAGGAVILIVVVAGVGVRALVRWMHPATEGPVPPSPFQQAAPLPARVPAAKTETAPAVAAPSPAVAPARPGATALPVGVVLSVTAHALCEMQYQPDAQRARWMTLKPGESTVLKARTQLRLLIGNPSGVEMSTPQGPVPLPKKSSRAEHLLITAAGVQKLALPVLSSTVQ
ncbi:MAG: RodZ domain-containing protein [Candidatus Coatesbacteria bacterium]